MNFSAIYSGQSPSGNCILCDVVAENGMHRPHVWLDQTYRGRFSSAMIGLRLSIRGKYRRYRSDAWTIHEIQSVEVEP